jgi:hypothetical protein
VITLQADSPELKAGDQPIQAHAKSPATLTPATLLARADEVIE